MLCIMGWSAYKLEALVSNEAMIGKSSTQQYNNMQTQEATGKKRTAFAHDPAEGRSTGFQDGDYQLTIPESFTYNKTLGCQTWPRQHYSSPKGLVVSLILTPQHDQTALQLQRLVCRSLPSQLTHLLGPQQWDLLLVIVGGRFKEQLSFDYLSDCLNLELRKENPTKTWYNLDGTRLTTTEYRWKDRVSLFLSHLEELEWPRYIQNDMSILQRQIEPFQCNREKSYIQGTRWYSNELLHLAILQDYQWFIKLDLDIYFVRTVEWNLLHDLQTRNSVFAHTAEYPSDMGNECAVNIVKAMQEFVKETALLSYCDHDNSLLQMDRDHYYSNFVICRVDFWTQPLVRQLGRFLSEYPAGFFHHRWTDQIFFAQAMGLLAHVNDHAATDYSELRCSIEPNCWYAPFKLQIYGTNRTFERCDNNAYFVHTKSSKFQWNRTVSYTGSLWQSDVDVHPLSYKDECKERISRKQNENMEKKKKKD